MILAKLPYQSPTITVMTKAVIKASKGLLRDFFELEHLQVSIKSNKSFVTSADMKANNILKEELLKAKPTYSLVSEESAEIVGEDPTHKWIIDPLDGTVNYMHGFPHWAISVALEKNQEIVAAVTYDPVRNEIFWTEKGCGAYVNDRKIRVSGKKSVNDLLISVGSVEINNSKIVPQIITNFSSRKTGSSTLDMAYIASGRSDVLFYFQNPLNKWDVAAGMLLVKEAGGVLATSDGTITNNYQNLAIACNIDLIPIAKKIYNQKNLDDIKSER
jgi:myo-inositol-1(or 4)-monophosphatase